MIKINQLITSIQAAGKSGDKALATKLTKELKAETVKANAKTKKMQTVLKVLQGKLKRS